MPVSTTYGPMRTGEQARRAVEDTIVTWHSAYLREFERQTGEDPGTFPTLASRLAAVDAVDPAQLPDWPALVTSVDGLVGTPERNGRTIEATWAVTVAVAVRGTTPRDTALLAHAYLASIRTLLLQHPSLGGFARAVRWYTEDVIDASDDSGRTSLLAMLGLGVTIGDVLDLDRGPLEPPVDPVVIPGPLPTIATFIVQTTGTS